MELAIDTDIGTDVDDLFALTYAIKNPYAEIKGFSTVIGDTVLRAKVARKLERMLGSNVQIIAGEKGPEESVKKYWTGIEELALTKEELDEPFSNSKYPVYTKDTKLVCIGPLTNIALQLKTNPSIKNIREIYVMGSNDSSHNFKADLPAWKLVQNEPWNIYQITKEVSEKISFTKLELQDLRVNPLGNFLYGSAVIWMDYTVKNSWIDHQPKTHCAMYDVLAVSAALGEPYVKFKKEQNKRFISADVDLDLKNKIVEVIKN